MTAEGSENGNLNVIIIKSGNHRPWEIPLASCRCHWISSNRWTYMYTFLDENYTIVIILKNLIRNHGKYKQNWLHSITWYSQSIPVPKIRYYIISKSIKCCKRWLLFEDILFHIWKYLRALITLIYRKFFVGLRLWKISNFQGFSNFNATT